MKALNVKQPKEEMYLSDLISRRRRTLTSAVRSRVVLRTRESMSEFKRPPRNNYSSFFVISFIDLLF